MRAKLPIGDWLWPAIWLLPRDNQYGGWPASGEIDIVESRGNSPEYGPGGYHQSCSRWNYFPDLETNDPKPWQNNGPNPVNHFYDAKDEWLPTWIQDFEIDSVKVWTPKQSEGSDPMEKSTVGQLTANLLLLAFNPASLAGLGLLLAAMFMKL